MTKERLLKFFSGEASIQEIREVEQWIAQSEDNRRYAAELKMLMVLSTMPQQEMSSAVKPYKSVIERNKFSRPFFVAVAAVALLLLAVNIFLVAQIGSTDPAVEQIAESKSATELTRVYTERGTKATIVLPDSSKVWMNSDTEIEYVAGFKGETRDVYLRGEAYFEVRKDSLKPMMIKIAKGYSIKVLGTKLHIKSYPNDNVSKTTLISGNIKVVFPADKHGNVEEISLSPSETLILGNVSKPKAVAQPINQISKDVAWREGELVFDKTPMSEVIKMLERWHGAEIVVENNTLYNHKLTATFKTESIIQILEVINMLTGIKYQIKDNNLVVLN